ncbi:citrate transporter [Kosmotoga pacifica]|uniref:Citrate transporter n=1 Tax=Kosmotoga pacifica TaxID=1330330 RepID=A0A0G2ZFB3_9BACT|nr:citrate transporter [Kosmotoga pacifica]
MNTLITLIIVVVTYGFIIFGKKNKAVITFGLALVIAAMKLVEGLEPENISRVIDLDTLGLLTGMMIIVAFLNSSGFFEYFSIKVIKFGGERFYFTLTLLMVVVALTSAFLDNVVTIIVMAPMMFLIADLLDMDPVPLIMLTLVIDNIGGGATLIGSPFNLVLGSISGFSFNDFIIKLGPASILVFMVLMLYFKKHIKVDASIISNIKKLDEMDENKAITDWKMMRVSLAVFLAVIILFVIHTVIGVELSYIALLGGIVLLLVNKKGFDHVSDKIDWDMLFFFAGLYIISHALESIGITELMANGLLHFQDSQLMMLIIPFALAAIFVPILNNVPAALIFGPVFRILVGFGFSTMIWWAFAISGNFATSLTPLGAVQNIVAITYLEREIGRSFGFKEYVRWMIMPVTISLVIGLLYILGLFAISK